MGQCCSNGDSSEPFDDSLCYKESVDVKEEIIEVGGDWSKVHVCSWVKEGEDMREERLKGLIIICHGVFEHGLRFHRLASALAEAGYAVYAADHPWHGRTIRPGEERGIIKDHQTILNNFVKSSKLLVARHSANLPKFCVAHSMGSLVCLNTFALLDWDGVVFSGTATVAGPGGASPFGCKLLYPVSKAESLLSCVLSVMSAIDPKGPVSPIRLEDLMSDSRALDSIAQDPHRFRGWMCNITAREIAHMLRLAKDPANLLKFKVPFTAIHGSADSICLPEAAEMLMIFTGTHSDLKEKIIIDGMMHECLKDPFDGSYPGVKLAIAAIKRMNAVKSSVIPRGSVDSSSLQV